ncbi:MAG: MgtC/SapB family protein [Oscillospiraceae bacterium]|nr:MgtC/SapB family protein [Oscillospiraceae bacterium]
MFENLCFFGYCLHELNAGSIFFRLALAVLLGGIIGLERGIKGRPAGMRTYMLVALGSALVMITNEYMAGLFIGVDPARMGAQVISGIGFLGAGTILITRDRQVRGLTTAASLWASACMGLAIGVGFYSGALIGMLFIFFITTGMHRLDTKLLSKSRSIDLYVELDEAAHIHKLLDHVRTAGMKVTSMESVRPRYDDESRVALLLALHLPTRKPHYELLAEMNEIDYVNFAEEV